MANEKQIADLQVGDVIIFNFGVTRAVTNIVPVGAQSARLFFGDDLSRIFRLRRTVDVEA